MIAAQCLPHSQTALPPNVGTYQFFTVVGLRLFGVDKTLATGFSIVVFVLLTLPLWVIGYFALSRSGMTLSQIKMKISKQRGEGSPGIAKEKN